MVVGCGQIPDEPRVHRSRPCSGMGCDREQADEAGACRGMVGAALSPHVAEAMRPLPWRALPVAGLPDLDGLFLVLAGVVTRPSDAVPSAKPVRRRNPLVVEAP